MSAQPPVEVTTESKVAALMTRADTAYEAEDQAWFDALPTEDLTALWGVACASEVSWDDEVFDALAPRGWFEKAADDPAKFFVEKEV